MHVAITVELLIPHEPTAQQACLLADQLVERGHRVSLLCAAERDVAMSDKVELHCMGRRMIRFALQLSRYRRWQGATLARLAPDATIAMTTLAPADIVIPCSGTVAGHASSLRQLRAPMPAKVRAIAKSFLPSIVWRRMAERRTLSSPATKACLALTGVIERELASAVRGGHITIERAEPAMAHAEADAQTPAPLRERLARAWQIDEGSAWLVFPFNEPWIAGIEPLIIAFKTLIDAGVDAVLLLAGRSRYTHLAWIAQLGLRDRVRFVDRPDHPEQLFDAVDIVVNPTAYDPGGWAMRSALHSGKPIVTTTASGAAEQVRRAGGVVLECPVDPQRLAGVLRGLIEGRDSAETGQLEAPASVQAEGSPADPPPPIALADRVLGLLGGPAGD